MGNGLGIMKLLGHGLGIMQSLGNGLGIMKSLENYLGKKGIPQEQMETNHILLF